MSILTRGKMGAGHPKIPNSRTPLIELVETRCSFSPHYTENCVIDVCDNSNEGIFLEWVFAYFSCYVCVLRSGRLAGRYFRRQYKFNHANCVKSICTVAGSMRCFSLRICSASICARATCIAYRPKTNEWAAKGERKKRARQALKLC